MERKKKIVLKDTPERNIIAYPDGTPIHQEITERAYTKAPNTLRYSIPLIVIGAAIAGPLGAVILGGLGLLYGASKDEEI